MRGEPALVAHGRGENPGQPPVDLLSPPKAAHPQVDHADPRRPRLGTIGAQRSAQHGMVDGHLKGIFGAPGQGIGGRDHAPFGAGEGIHQPGHLRSIAHVCNAG